MIFKVGHAYPMEAHFVHADKDGNLAVIALMFKAGEKNVALEKVWAHMPAKPDEKITVLLPLINIIGAVFTYFYFSFFLGSGGVQENIPDYYSPLFFTSP